MINSLNYLKNQAKFSTDEIIPVLEQKISLIKGEEYAIEFFITNLGDSTTTLDVHYYAFPKQFLSNNIIKAAFIHDEYIYEYIVQDDKHEKLRKTPLSQYKPEYTILQDRSNIQHIESFRIGHETIKMEEALEYLLLPHKPKYHLFNNFFCYNEELESLNDTIENFAKQKVSTR